MLSHVNKPEAIGAASAALGGFVAFLPWYGYASGNSHVTVNAFRASLLGDVFFVAIAAAILLLLIGRGFVDDVVTPSHSRDHGPRDRCGAGDRECPR